MRRGESEGGGGEDSTGEEGEDEGEEESEVVLTMILSNFGLYKTFCEKGSY